MPELSRFFGIIVSINPLDHTPPHFHVRYQGWKASIRINDFGLEDGDLPPKQFGRVVEWAKLHQKELAEAWRLTRKGQPVEKIEPLRK